MLAHLHLLPSAELATARVSQRSLWSDPVWYFDQDKPSLEYHRWTFRWDIDTGNGSTLLDSQWAPLLEASRRFVWSVFSDSREGPPLATSSCLHVRSKLAKLLGWMAKSSYTSFDQLDAEASWEYHDYLARERREAHGDELKASAVEPYLYILVRLFRQSEALRDAGVAPVPEEPYDGQACNALAEKMATSANGWIEPLPDEVALRLLGASIRMLGVPADDIVRLQATYLSARVTPGVKWNPKAPAVERFEFGTIPGEQHPWRKTLGEDSGISWETKIPFSRPAAALRALVSDLTGACVTLIQGTTGMRISEVASIRAGVSAETGLPACVSVEPSKSGLNELFFVRSQEVKIRDGERLEWLLGMRPKGSNHRPPAVEALLVLQRLYEPWRQLSGLDHLMLQLGAASSLPKTAKDVRPVDGTQLLAQMKAFAWRHGNLQELPDSLRTASGTLDLSGYKSGEAVRSHQWRKTFALYVLRTDSRMLPAISQHFKHLSLAMTEQGYIGNDPELLDAIESVRRQRTVQFFLDQLGGKTPLAGGMAALIDQHRVRLQEIAGDAGSDAARQRIEAWVVESDLRIWFADRGKCFIGLQPGESRCHKAGGTDPWLKLAPNVKHQNIAECSACKCFAVDGEHASFWEDRLRQNEAVLAAAGPNHRGEYRIAVERVRQAKSVLKAIGKLDTKNGDPE